MNKYEVCVIGEWDDDPYTEVEFEDVIVCEGELTREVLEWYEISLAEKGMHNPDILVNINGEWKGGI